MRWILVERMRVATIAARCREWTPKAHLHCPCIDAMTEPGEAVERRGGTQGVERAMRLYGHRGRHHPVLLAMQQMHRDPGG